MVGVWVSVGVTVGVLVKEAVWVGVGVSVIVGVWVSVGVAVGVLVREAVWVGVGVSVIVGVWVSVGVAVGDWQKVDAVAVPILPPPETDRSRVPKIPLVLILVDCPAVN
jgi:hypothetical protein